MSSLKSYRGRSGSTEHKGIHSSTFLEFSASCFFVVSDSLVMPCAFLTAKCDRPVRSLPGA